MFDEKAGYRSLNKNTLHRPIENGSTRMYDFVGGSISLGVGFESQMLKPRPVSSDFLLPLDPVVELSTLLWHHVCLHATMLPTMIIKD